MARLTLILGVLATVIYLLDGFRFVLNEWRNWRNKGKWLVVLGLVLIPGLADATCTGSGTVWTCTGASDTTIADVNSAIASSSDGATITLDAGTYTWTTGSLLFNAAKSTTVICASVLGCTATVGTGLWWSHNDVNGATSSATQKTWRVSGIRFEGTAPCSTNKCIWIYPRSGQPIQYITLRIDHNYFAQMGDATDFALFGEGSSVRPMVFQGSIDHNTFVNDVQTRLDVEGPWTTASNATPYSSTLLGQTTGCLFFEDNEIQFTAPTNSGLALIDGKSGACLVVRFNTILNGRFTVHGVTHAFGTVNFEVYGNAFTTDANNADGFDNCERRIHMQGSGTASFWNNSFVCVGAIDTYAITVLHYRDGIPADTGAATQCDGLTSGDANTAPEATHRGYPCKNQPGRAIAGGTPEWGTIAPIPIFKNFVLSTGAKVNMNFGCPWPTAPHYCSEHVQSDRDFYNAVSKDAQTTSSSPFDGTTGIGHGTLANRPTTCTHTTPPADDGGGVMYWATDQGSWNSSSSNPWGVQMSGADGVLYQCSATDTWTVYYTPAPYPRFSSEDITTPSSPVVIARVMRWMEVAAFVTGMGWHFRKQVMAISLAAIAGCGTLYQLAPRSYDTVKVVSKESAVKVLTVFNHLTKPRV